jgi:hypothetical protein
MNDDGRRTIGGWTNKQMAEWRVKRRLAWLASLQNSRGNRRRR